MQSNEYIKKQTVYEILDGMKRIRDRDRAGLISDTVSACIRCVEGNVMVAHAEDVVPVVRCVDCKHNNACLTQAFVEDESRVPFDRNTFFCADGKRDDTRGWRDV